MSSLLAYLGEHWAGILVLIFILLSLALFVNWLCWIFGIGRFKARDGRPAGASGLRYVLTDFFVKIISEFRHLLALVIVSLFAATLFLAMIPGIRAWDVEKMKEGIQAVAAVLGGLIGSIIGYYFGESAAVSRETPPASGQGPPVQQPPGPTPQPGLQPAAKPAGATGGSATPGTPAAPTTGAAAPGKV